MRRTHRIWKNNEIIVEPAKARTSPRTPRSGVAIDPSTRIKIVAKTIVSNNSFGRPVAWKKTLKFQKKGRKMANGMAQHQTLWMLCFHVAPRIGPAANHKKIWTSATPRNAPSKTTSENLRSVRSKTSGVSCSRL